MNFNQKRIDEKVALIRAYIATGDKHSANIVLDELNKAVKELLFTNIFLLQSAEFHRAQNEKVNAAETRIVETASDLVAAQQTFLSNLQAILNPAPVNQKG